MRLINIITLVFLLIIAPLMESGKSTASLPQRRNESKEYTFKILKYISKETPYKRTQLHYFKTILRRNQPTLLNMSLTIPEVLNYIWVRIKLHYKFNAYQPFLIDMEQEACEYIRNRPIIPQTDYIYETFVKRLPAIAGPCPHGNRTYDIVWWLEERHTPRSIPAGEYRLDMKFVAIDNVTLFASETYFTARRKGILRSMIEW